VEKCQYTRRFECAVQFLSAYLATNFDDFAFHMNNVGFNGWKSNPFLYNHPIADCVFGDCDWRLYLCLRKNIWFN